MTYLSRKPPLSLPSLEFCLVPGRKFNEGQNYEYPRGYRKIWWAGCITLLYRYCDGALLICVIDEELRIKRYRSYPQPHLEDWESAKRERFLVDEDGYSCAPSVFGVITHIVNNARSGEFGACPLMRFPVSWLCHECVIQQKSSFVIFLFVPSVLAT